MRLPGASNYSLTCFVVHFARGRGWRRRCRCWCCRDWGCDRVVVAVCRQRGSGVALQAGAAGQIYRSLGRNSPCVLKRLHISSGKPLQYLVKPTNITSAGVCQTICRPYLHSGVTLFRSQQSKRHSLSHGTQTEQHPHLKSHICTLLSLLSPSTVSHAHKTAVAHSLPENQISLFNKVIPIPTIKNVNAIL